MNFVYTFRVKSALKSFSNSQLHEETLKAAAREKSATLTLLEHLAEVDRRRLYSELSYQSLWEYTHKALHYSESQASERVSAMRLMVKVPELKSELQAGSLNLTAVSKLAYHVKREKLEVKDTVELLAAIKDQPIKQVERILAKESTQPARPDFVRIVTPKTTRISIEVDLEFMELLNRAKELKGDLSLSPQEVFKLSLQEYVKKREIKTTQKTFNQTLIQASVESPTQKITPAIDHRARNESDRLHSNEVGPGKMVSSKEKYPSQEKASDGFGLKRPRSIPTSVKTQVRLRSQDRCEWIDPQSKRRCTGKAGLQFDHHHPFALGGGHTLENIRHLCPNHNRFAAIQIFGEKKIRHYFKNNSRKISES